MAAPRISVGSRIKVTQQANCWYAFTGTVQEIDSRDGDLLVKFDTGSVRFIRPDHVSLFTPPAAPRRGRGSAPLIERVLEVAHHRNGISGAPFYAVRFTHIDDAGERRQMLATVFDYHRIAVIATDRLLEDGVEFGKNSWRGDTFEAELRLAIAKHEGFDSVSAHLAAGGGR